MSHDNQVEQNTVSDEDRELRARLGAREWRKLMFQRDQVAIGWTWRDLSELDMHARSYEMVGTERTEAW